MTDTPQLLLVHHLKTLKLPTFLREYDKLARQCAAAGAGHVRYLVRLAELELIDRERGMVERRIRQARFPAVKSLDSFDFKAIPSLNKMLVVELARCEGDDIAHLRGAAVVVQRQAGLEVHGAPRASAGPDGGKEGRLAGRSKSHQYWMPSLRSPNEFVV